MSDLGDSRSVVVVTPWFPDAPGEREGNFVYDSARAIAAHGGSVSVVIARPYGPRNVREWTQPRLRGTKEARDFSEFNAVKLVNYASVPRNWAPEFSDACLDRSLIPSISEAVSVTPASIIHAHTEAMAPAAVHVGRTTGAKVVVTLHGVNFARRYFELPSRRERFQRALSQADRVILVGNSLRTFFKELVGRDDHFRCVPNGYSLTPFARRRAVLDDRADVHFISVSNLHQGKGLDDNLVSLALLLRKGQANWSYTIVGDGRQRSRLRRMVRSLGLEQKVSFAGAVPPAEVPRYLAAADVFILPSYREAFGIAYLEAMAAGLLTIGVEGQGPSSFIEHGVSGLLVPPRDAEGLAQQLSAIFDDFASFRCIAAYGAGVACERFTWEKHAAGIAAIYQELLGARN